MGFYCGGFAVWSLGVRFKGSKHMVSIALMFQRSVADSSQSSRMGKLPGRTGCLAEVTTTQRPTGPHGRRLSTSRHN